MIQEVFSEAFIFPVLGAQDTFPQRFFPFANRDSITNWSPELSKREQYIDRNVHVTQSIFEDWRYKYPFNADHRAVAALIPSELTLDDTTFLTDYGYYAIQNVPY